MNRENFTEAVWNSTGCRKYGPGDFVPAECRLVAEKELAIHIDGEHLATASIMPSMEREFVIGYLLGQGFIDGVAGLLSVEINGGKAAVTLEQPDRTASSRKTSYRIVSGGGRTTCAGEVENPVIETDLQVRRDVVFQAMNMLFEEAGVYAATEGTHAAGLFTAGGQAICIAEDIGRHNTLDKVIGYALVNEIDCRHTFLVSTGRMTSEMIAKICRAGIPIVATKTAVTDRGIEIGRRGGVTVIGFVRDAGTQINTDMETRTIARPVMKIYTHPGRIVWE